MALPSSGQISMDDIRIELGVPTQSPFSLNTARQGGYVALNFFSPTQPPSSGQVALSDWYSYCQSCGYYTYSLGYDASSSSTACSASQSTFYSNVSPLGIGDTIYVDTSGNAGSSGYYSDGTTWYEQNLNESEQMVIITTDSCIPPTTTTTTTQAPSPVPYTIDSFGTGSSFDACTYGSPSVSVYASYFYNVPMVGMIFYDSPSLTTPYVGGSGWRKFTNGTTNYAGEVDTNGELTNYVTC
jgi:hypothetical protein